MNSTVTCELRMRVILSSESYLPVPASLRYDTADPYAVRAVFHVGDGASVDWVFARESLAEGLHRPAGIGDVQVWPSRRHGRDVVCIALNGEGGEALLHAPAKSVESFLRRTDAVVPPGTEHDHLNLDQELSRFLAES